MISINSLTVEFTGEALFDNISFIINKRDRIGLVGKNGAGKTTLMRIIVGEFNPEKGSVSMPSDCKIGYLPQEIDFQSKKTVIAEALQAFTEVKLLEKEIREVTEAITKRTDYHTSSYNLLTQRLAEASERYELLEGSTHVAQTERVLLGLGFNRQELTRPMAAFSGGWQMRVVLAKLLLQRPHLLLLDEPTNHLDIESIQWLEGFLADYPGAVMLVSHDRAFLDNITNRTIEISMGKAYDYKACYSDYELLRQERMMQEVAAYNNQQREIAQIERFITRFRAKSTKARQVQSKVKLLEKMDKVEVEESDKRTISFRFPEAPPSGKVSLEAINISKSYGDHQVLSGLNFMVSRGERIAFVGRNGEGKTTLARIITGELEHQGNISIGHQVSIGYFAQNQAEFLNPDKTVFQTLDDAATGEIRKEVRNILGGFLFSGHDIDKKVKVLSGGEKTRLAIARMLLDPVNLLIMDEPTNHLDMRSKDILKSALLHFGGTIIIVSHDRDFLQGLTDKVFEFRNRQVKEFMGDIYDFISARRIASLNSLEAAKEKKHQPADEKNAKGKASYEQKKANEREIRKIEKKIAKCEEEIEAMEAQMEKLEKIIANPSLDQEKMDGGDIFTAYDILKKKIREKEAEWEQSLLALEDKNPAG